MANELDPRIVKIGIEVNDVIKWYTFDGYNGPSITAVGSKYANANQNECEVKIANLVKSTRDYILTATSPFNKNPRPKRLIVEAGRVSYGTTRIFVGDITSSGITQPPDIVLSLKCLTKNHSKGNVISRNQAARTPLSRIANGVAGDLGIKLDFQADDKYVANYGYCGGALQQVDALGEAGNVDAYVDDDTLVVKAANAPLRGFVRKLNLDSGLIGIPQIDEQGVQVTFLLDNKTKLGSGLELTSALYPSLNGTYVIYKLGFSIASRDTPFYWVAKCKRRV